MQEAKGWGIQRLLLVSANVWGPTCRAQHALGSQTSLDLEVQLCSAEASVVGTPDRSGKGLWP